MTEPERTLTLEYVQKIIGGAYVFVEPESAGEHLLLLAKEVLALRQQVKQITHCENCGANWCDDGNNAPHCPYCTLKVYQVRETGP